jgi:uncharacterized protein (DUF302 family)
MSQNKPGYSLVKPVLTDYSETIEVVTTALAKQGFGILTQIDISATLKKKINVDYPKTIVLGACNPPLAHRALTTVADIAVLLPCNVVVRENNQGGVEVAAMDPQVLVHYIDDPEIHAVAKEVGDKIQAVFDSLS